MRAPFKIRAIPPAEVGERVPALAALLLDAVQDNASIGFLDDLTPERAAGYWSAFAGAPGGRVLLVGEDEHGVAGAVIVAPVATEIQPHRAEVFKMVVLRRARGKGLGAALMREAEHTARSMGKTLVTLFTRDGSPAERLYSRLGWVKVGVIPEDSVKPDRTLCDAAIFYKRIPPE
jgi:GNAT superfamily N-acetyltransferase